MLYKKNKGEKNGEEFALSIQIEKTVGWGGIKNNACT